LFIPFIFFTNQHRDKQFAEYKAKEAQEKAEKLEKQKKESIAYFNENSESILSNVKNAIDNKGTSTLIITDPFVLI